MNNKRMNNDAISATKKAPASVRRRKQEGTFCSKFAKADGTYERRLSGKLAISLKKIPPLGHDHLSLTSAWFKRRPITCGSPEVISWIVNEHQDVYHMYNIIINDLYVPIQYAVILTPLSNRCRIYTLRITVKSIYSS